MLHLIDRYFIKKPLIRRFVTKLLAGDCERKVTLLAGDYLVHTVREHGLFRASRLARTCSLFRDEVPFWFISQGCSAMEIHSWISGQISEYSPPISRAFGSSFQI